MPPKSLGDVNLLAEVEDAWGSEPSTPSAAESGVKRLAPVTPGLKAAAAAFVPAAAAAAFVPAAAAATPAPTETPAAAAAPAATGMAETAALKTAVANVAAGKDAAAAAAGPSEADLAMKAAVRNNNAAIKVDESKIQVERAPGCAGCKKVETWDELNAMAGGVKIPQPVFQAITDVLKYATPSSIQKVALPLMLMNPPTDIIFQSQTGTGKTAAFAITMLSRCDPNIKGVQAVCVCHTIHLAQQTAKVVNQLAKLSSAAGGLSAACHHGLDKEHGKAQFMLRKGEKIEAQVLVATTGKFLAYLNKGTEHLDPKLIKVVVVDEADAVVDSGDQRKTSDIKEIKAKLQLAHKRGKTGGFQMVLLSATFEPHVLKYAKELVQDCMNCNVLTLPKQEVSVKNVKQLFCNCHGEAGKYEVLETIYNSVDVGQALIFVERRDAATRLALRMKDDGHDVDALTGGMVKVEQTALLDRFRAGEIKVLIATNMLSRGVDVDKVSLVVNFDMPVKKGPKGGDEADPVTYNHRIGRTGRFGKTGSAITLVDHTERDQVAMFDVIRRHYGSTIEELVLDRDEDELDKILAETDAKK